MTRESSISITTSGRDRGPSSKARGVGNADGSRPSLAEPLKKETAAETAKVKTLAPAVGDLESAQKEGSPVVKEHDGKCERTGDGVPGARAYAGDGDGLAKRSLSGAEGRQQVGGVGEDAEGDLPARRSKRTTKETAVTRESSISITTSGKDRGPSSKARGVGNADGSRPSLAGPLKKETAAGTAKVKTLAPAVGDLESTQKEGSPVAKEHDGKCERTGDGVPGARVCAGDGDGLAKRSLSGAEGRQQVGGVGEDAERDLPARRSKRTTKETAVTRESSISMTTSGRDRGPSSKARGVGNADGSRPSLAEPLKKETAAGTAKVKTLAPAVGDLESTQKEGSPVAKVDPSARASPPDGEDSQTMQ